MTMFSRENVTPGAYTASSPIAARLIEAVCVPDLTSIVFVVEAVSRDASGVLPPGNDLGG
jgi:hypothetical protein